MGKIFTSITGPSINDCKKQVRNVHNAELRLDLVDLAPGDIQKLWPGCSHWMITVRKEFLSMPGWKELFTTCTDLRPAYIDLDCTLDPPVLEMLKDICSSAKTSLILSYHNYRETPSFEALKDIVRSLFELGADVVKLACMVNDHQDNISLLKLYGEYNRLIAIGMGEKGKISRFNALYFGEKVSYAASSQAKAAAPGQLTYREMLNLERVLKCY